MGVFYARSERVYRIATLRERRKDSGIGLISGLCYRECRK